MQGKRTNITKVMLEKIFKYGLSPLIFACTLLAGLIIVNYLISIKNVYFDVTKNKVNTLSRETENLLEDINFDITIKAFYQDANQRTIGLLLNKYVDGNDHIKLEFIDPIKNPLTAEEYEVTLPRTIIFEAVNKSSRINPPLPRQRHGEREITIALYRLMTEQTKKGYFTTGHGEFSTSNRKQEGLNIVQERLTEQNYIIETVNLLEEGKVPEDCTLLIIAGPTVPFTDEEAEMVNEYLGNAGSIVAMVGPDVQANLDNIMLRYGLQFGDDYIYETSSKLTVTELGGPITPFCSPQDTSVITEKLPNQNFPFRKARSVNKNFPAGRIKITKLMASSENSWAETDLESIKTVNTNIKPSRDENEKKGPITVAVVTEREFDLPDSVATRDINTYQVRSAFFGNAEFITNYIVSLFPSNLNLFLNTVNWITRNEKIIEVTPHLTTFTPVELRPSQRSKLTWLTLVVFPSSILMVGFIVWFRRR